MRNKLLSGLNFERKEVKEMKKILAVLLLLFLGLFIAPGNSSAVPVSMSLDGLWDWGTLYNFNGAVWTPNNPLPNVNPYYGTTSQNIPNGVVVAPDGTEDSYGPFRVNTIYPTAGGPTIYDRATAPYELTGLFFGFDDIYIGGTLAFARILQEGGHAALYADFAKNYDATNPLGPGPVPQGGRWNQSGGAVGDGFLTATDGVLMLDLTPVMRVDADTGATYTLENFFSFVASAGAGNVLFDVTGGLWAPYFDTNTLELGSDIRLDFASFPAYGHPQWTVQGVGNVQADLIPEPGTILLMGVGLIGIGIAGHRRFRRK